MFIVSHDVIAAPLCREPVLPEICQPPSFCSRSSPCGKMLLAVFAVSLGRIGGGHGDSKRGFRPRRRTTRKAPANRVKRAISPAPQGLGCRAGSFFQVPGMV